MPDALTTPMLSQRQLRAELEVMVEGKLLGTARGKDEEQTEHTEQDSSARRKLNYERS